jgi:hypothetical protein
MTPQIQGKLVELRRWIPKSDVERLLDETTELYLKDPSLFEEYVLLLIDEFQARLKSCYTTTK